MSTKETVDLVIKDIRGLKYYVKRKMAKTMVSSDPYKKLICPEIHISKIL